MRCSSCGFDSPDGMKFCGECGASLQPICSSCGFKNPPGFKFCGECGVSLRKREDGGWRTEDGGWRTENGGQRREEDFQPSVVSAMNASLSVSQSSKPKAKSQKPKSTGAERRQVSVMFCDLVGSTALSERVDPEELREMVLAYQEGAATAIRQNGGQIARSFGDGLLVYFGYPVSYEDNPQRAVRAGLGIIAEMKTLNQRLMLQFGVELKVRIGIHTGLAVVGEMGSGDILERMAIVGETPNVAARIESLAATNTVAISSVTYRLVQGYFECESMGLHQLKGISEPMAVYRVVRSHAIRNRLDLALQDLTPYVGRETELDRLMQAWEQAQAGQGQVVVLTGEAGLGKSRLVRAFKQRLAGMNYLLREFQCCPYHQNTAFYPIAEMMRSQVLGFASTDTYDQKLTKLEQFLDRFGLPLAEGVPLFARLLALPLNGRYAPLNLSPQAQKQKLLAIVGTVLRSQTAQQPALLIFEDLRWIDPSTLDLTSQIVEQTARYPILRLFTARPSFKYRWPERDYLTHINLSPLADSQAEVLIEALTDGKSLPQEVLSLVLEKSDRVPLFVEEMTRTILESGWLHQGEDAYELTGPLPNLAIPATLQDLLMARLDRLEGAKEVAQIGATIGREFSYDLISPLSPVDRETLLQGLNKLVEAQLLYAIGELPAARYQFKHALIQDVAYESLLKSTRKRYHQEIARVLENQFPDLAESDPEMLAYHCTRADLKAEGIRYWHQAGKQAVAASANEEAIGHLQQGLELLGTLPETLERHQRELELRTTLGTALITTKGYGSEEVEQNYTRSEVLCQQLGETPQLFWVLWGLWAFYTARAQHRKAMELGQQRLMALAQRQQDSALELEAHFALGFSSFLLGDLAAAREHCEQCLALYDPEQHHVHALQTGQDAGVIVQGFLSWVLCLLGLPEAGLDSSRAAIALAQNLSHSFSLAHALACSAIFYQFRQEDSAVMELAEATIAIAAEQQFPYWSAVGTLLKGWALTQQGQIETGIAHLQQGLTAYRATGSKLMLPYLLSLLVEAYLKANQPKAAQKILDEALAAVEATDECYWENRLGQLQANLL